MNKYCRSAFAAFAVLLLVGLLLYRKGRTFPRWLAPHPATYYLHRQVLKQLVYVLTRLGARLTKWELILIGFLNTDLPRDCPSSKLTTLLAWRSLLLPTITQLTFWSMDLFGGSLTCSFRRTSGPHYRSFIGR